MTHSTPGPTDAPATVEPTHRPAPDRWTVGLEEVDRRHVAEVGGKGAQLGELTRVEGVGVPAGFVVTTAAFRAVLRRLPSIGAHLDHLAGLTPDDLAAVGAVSAEIRGAIARADVPDDVAGAITGAVAARGAGAAWAVRSSATAEDLPDASFAGQHDSSLGVVGAPQVLRHVRSCWASLFTERAVVYRMRHGIDHGHVAMAVVVQRMVEARCSGVMFTADPVTGDRRVASVEATVGLGAALVSGSVVADAYRVRDGAVVDATAGAQRVAPRTAPHGGIVEGPIDPARRSQAALTDDEVVELVRIGRVVEAHVGCPQDVEWCLDDSGFRVVQARPITTLFPVPEVDDDARHVYVSVGHQQMMTDPMTPLGLSVWQLTSPAPMRTAGSRLFVDITARLASPAARAAMLEVFGRSDPLLRDALGTLLDRDGDGAGPATAEGAAGDEAAGNGGAAAPAGPVAAPEPIETDPAVVTELIAQDRAAVAALREEIATRSGPEVFDAVLADLRAMRARLFAPPSHQAVMAGMEAAWWLDDHLHRWLGERNPSAVLSLAAPNNVTAEMGLALLDVADAVRPHPEVVALLRGAEDDGFLDALAGVEGGPEARDAIAAYLDAYGMRCVGEIDIARPRWCERPVALLPAILSNVEHFAPGESERRLRRGRQDARAKEAELVARLRDLPGGDGKAARTREMIARLRTFIGYREYPKYGMVSRYLVYKQALLAEARRLVDRGLLDAPDDAFLLTFQELHDAVRRGGVDRGLVERRRTDLRSHAALTPPRVLTSDGEVFDGAYRRSDVPAGALPGLGVSGGTVEGRARVVLDVADADLRPGDILVTAHTDPSWSPLFVTVAGLVTEVGGLMTHGAVIAREYGLTAVVGVADATRTIRDGQRIRVDGRTGHVELDPELDPDRDPDLGPGPGPDPDAEPPPSPTEG